MRDAHFPADGPDRRDAILDAALALFAERGFHGTAVPLVAERARVGAGTIYRYFESKEQLVNVVFRRWKSALGHAIVTDFPFAAPPREQFHVFWGRLTTFARENPVALQFLELHHHAEYLDDASRAVEAEVLAPAFAFVERAQDEQVLKELPAPLLMSLVWGAFLGVVKASWEGRLVLTDEMAEFAESCCWEAIRR